MNVPVKLECCCGAKMEFNVVLNETAEQWTARFNVDHGQCAQMYANRPIIINAPAAPAKEKEDGAIKDAP